MWSAILFIIALVALVALCATECCQSRADARREHPDNSMCRVFLMFVCAMVIAHALHEPPKLYVPDPKYVYFWMRSSRNYKGHWQITDYRKPSTALPSNDYLMGVEMAKTNMCSGFNFGHDADIDQFKRCIYFFPELLHLYRHDHEQRAGICIEV